MLPALVGFEADATIPKIGAGTRTEGHKFETSLIPFWKMLAEELAGTARPIEYVQLGSHTWGRVRVETRSVFLPAPYPVHAQAIDVKRHTQMGSVEKGLQTKFKVSELVNAYPGENTVVRRYAPTSGPFAGDAYPQIYAEMGTEYDGTILLMENDDVLVEKILLEYKTAKSSKGLRLDGNAHERLTFQMMQYLQVAHLYSRCSLAVFATDSFVRYKNKYHVNFCIQKDILAELYDGFHIDYLATVRDYLSFVENIRTWLNTGRGRGWSS